MVREKLYGSIKEGDKNAIQKSPAITRYCQQL